MKYTIVGGLQGLDLDRLKSAVDGAQGQIDNWSQAKSIQVSVVDRVSGKSSRERKFPTTPQHDGVDFSVWKFKVMPMVRKDLRKIYTIQVELLGLPQPKFVPAGLPAPVPIEKGPTGTGAQEPVSQPDTRLEEVSRGEEPPAPQRKRRKDAPRIIPRLDPTQMSSLIDLVLSLEEPRKAIGVISTIRQELRRAEERLADCESRERAKVEQIEKEIVQLLTA